MAQRPAKPRPLTLKLAAVPLALTALAQLALAQPASEPGLAPALEKQADPREKLEVLQRKLEADRARQQALDAQRALIAKEMAKLQEDLVSAAAESQALERKQSEIEQRLADLIEKEGHAETAFNVKREKLASLLAVLQRMGREPPPALLVQPANAADAARSAMVLTTVLPGVRDDARSLGTALAKLRALRHAAAKAKVDLTSATDALTEQRKRIASLLADKNKLADRTSADLKIAVQSVEASTREVRDLAELVQRVSGEVKSLSDSGFGSANFMVQRGRLPWPANGDVIAQFGEDNELGLKNNGIALKTRPNAQVVSPVEGKIAFAGAFAGYGNMLIIAAGDDYHIVLSGMAAIYGAVGQSLLTGEPVGRMGGQGQDGERLGIEFRHGRNPVDPKPWFGARDEHALDKGHG
jgi:septal ring factor EnvC (AmiA/AmiB activator)